MTGHSPPCSASLSPRLAAALERLDARIDWERRDRGALRQDLGPMQDLAARLGHPERTFRAVHVAGSKGKGSVSALIASALEPALGPVGLYASPHVERVTERVSIGGRPVADDLLAEGIERALAALAEAEREGTPAAHATWFDLLTAAAFLAFAARGVAWAVVEVGLGGRLDSTNVVPGEVAVVTTIELEHAELLGPTRARIAREKAGILKPGATLVAGPPPESEAGRELFARAAQLALPAVAVPPARGVHEANRRLAGAALDALGARGVLDRAGRPIGAQLLTPERVAAARLPGRLERFLVDGVPVVLDGAHTPESLAAVLEELAGRTEPGRPFLVVLSLARDKDASAILKVLQGRADRVHCTSVGTLRHRPAGELRDLTLAAGLEAVAFDSPSVAVISAVDAAKPEGWVLVTGSLYLVGAVRGDLTTVSPGDPGC